MKTSYPTSINTINDVKNFFNYLVDVRKLNFHPDDRFEDYINYQTKQPTFTYEECEEFDYLMEECFSVCDEYGEDIYELATEIINK